MARSSRRLLRGTFFAAAVALGVSSSMSQAAPRVELSRPSLRLAVDEALELEVKALSGPELRVVPSEGRLLELSRDEGSVRYRWFPGAPRHPRLAVLAFWEASEGCAELVVARVPLLGRTELAPQTEPNADVTVEVAGEAFGPVRADADGRARIPVDVPPGVDSATVRAAMGGLQTSRTVPLAPAPPGAPAIVLSPLPVRALAPACLDILSATERTELPYQVRVVGGSATRSFASAERSTWQLVVAPGASRLEATVSLGERELARVSAEVDRRPAPVAPPPPPRWAARWAASAGAGAFLPTSGGLGVIGALTFGRRLPVLENGLFVEASAGAHRVWLVSRGSAGNGAASVTAFPLELSVRPRISERGPWSLDVRAGLGLVPFAFELSEGAAAHRGASLAFDTFAAVQVGRRFRLWEPFAELRWTIGPFQAGPLSADGAGLSLSLGARYFVL